MGKKKAIEIKDLPILHVDGKNYYALNVVVQHLKQNVESMKKMTMKKFKEEYDTFKLVGAGTWVEVELFNELSCKMTKVVVKTLDQEIRSKEDGAKLSALFFVKDEKSRKAHEQVVANIPNKAMEEVVKFENIELKDGEKLLDKIDNLIKVANDFKSHGYDVQPHMREDGQGYLVGDGVFVEVRNDGYDYSTFTQGEELGDWESHKYGKLCCYVDSYRDEKEHMEEFVSMAFDFTGMTPNEALIECWNRQLMYDECDWLSVKGTDVTIYHDELLVLLGCKSDYAKEKRWVDLSPFGFEFDYDKSCYQEEDGVEVVEAEFVQIVEDEVDEVEKRRRNRYKPMKVDVIDALDSDYIVRDVAIDC